MCSFVYIDLLCVYFGVRSLGYSLTALMYAYMQNTCTVCTVQCGKVFLCASAFASCSGFAFGHADMPCMHVCITILILCVCDTRETVVKMRLQERQAM